MSIEMVERKFLDLHKKTTSLDREIEAAKRGPVKVSEFMTVVPRFPSLTLKSKRTENQDGYVRVHEVIVAEVVDTSKVELWRYSLKDGLMSSENLRTLVGDEINSANLRTGKFSLHYTP